MAKKERLYSMGSKHPIIDEDLLGAVAVSKQLKEGQVYELSFTFAKEKPDSDGIGKILILDQSLSRVGVNIGKEIDVLMENINKFTPAAINEMIDQIVQTALQSVFESDCSCCDREEEIVTETTAVRSDNVH